MCTKQCWLNHFIKLTKVIDFSVLTLLALRFHWLSSAGIFKTMFKDTQKYAARSLALLDKRMENLFSVGFIPNFRKIPNKVWVSGSSLQANEYRTLMQVCFFHAS